MAGDTVQNSLYYAASLIMDAWRKTLITLKSCYPSFHLFNNHFEVKQGLEDIAKKAGILKRWIS